MRKVALETLVKQLAEKAEILDHICVFRIRKPDGNTTIAVITKDGGSAATDRILLMDAYAAAEGVRKITKLDEWVGLDAPPDPVEEVLG